MGITIDKAIQILEQHHMWTGEPQEVTNVRVENKAMQVAIDTMRKYQKIQKIMHTVYTSKQADECLVQRLSEIREVLEDGNDD